MWYVSVTIKPKLSAAWIVQLKKILLMSCEELKLLKVSNIKYVHLDLTFLCYIQFGLPFEDELIKLHMKLVSLVMTPVL